VSFACPGVPWVVEGFDFGFGFGFGLLLLFR
jgi:hypothetical protein